MDVLSDILQRVRLRGTVYFQHDFVSPWGMEMAAGPLAQFHLVVRGQCGLYAPWMAQPIPLAAGDMVLFLNGDIHWLADKPDHPRVPGDTVLAAYRQEAPLFQGEAVCTTLICGHFTFDRLTGHPLFGTLPGFIHVSGATQYGDTPLEGIARLLIHETRSQQPGMQAVVDRLAEALFVQLIRAYMVQAPAGGYLDALTDRAISRALSVMHEQPGSPWTLAEIAGQVGLSRASFARRFRELVGMTPMHYLTAWRMQVAHDLLRDTDLPLAAVAEKVGYGSEAAFHRAFKRVFNENPGARRRALQAGLAVRTG